MKKAFLVLTSLVLFSINIFAEDFRFEVSPVYDFQNGVLNEYVFRTDTNGECQKLSELNWNVVNSSNVGIKLNAFYKIFNLSCDFSGAIPGLSGVMYDSDWMNYSDTSMKTNYSISTNTIDEGYDIDVQFGASFRPLNWLKIKPFVQYAYNYIAFVSSDAEGWYGNASSSKTGENVSYDDENAKHYEIGQLCSIDYSRNTHNLYSGIQFDLSFLNYFTFFTSFAAAPLNYVSSIDIHYSNLNKTSGTMYNDRMLGYFNCYSVNAGFEYSPVKLLSIGLKGEYNYIHLIYGKTYTKYYSKSSSSKFSKTALNNSYAGCSGYLINACLYVTFHF